MPRRGRRRGRRGDGTITAKDGRFVARYSHTEGGVRKRESKTFHLRIDAEWWLSQAKRHQQAPEDVRVAEYMERWLSGKRGIAGTTRVLYDNHVRVHILPVLGRYRLVELQRRHIEAFVDDRVRYVSPSSGRHLSPKTIGAILVTLRSALAEAVPRTIPDNPAAKVEAPKVTRRPVRAMTPDDATALLAAVEGTWTEYIVRFLLGSGLRIGEAVALNQEDVQDGYVRLRQSKTTLRAVRMSADANEAIHQAIRLAPRRGREEPAFFGPARGGHMGYRRPLGHDRLQPNALKQALPAILEEAGLPRLTAHKLRHGTATLMVRAGVPMRQVAEQLGHADAALTARVYAHVAPDSMIAAMKVLDEAVKR